MAKSDTVSIKINREQYDQIKAYSLIKSKTVQQVLNSGLQWWLETWVEAEIEHIVETTAAQLQHDASVAND